MVIWIMGPSYTITYFCTTTRATTRTGLRVVAQLWDKVYETGRKVAANFKETMRIVFDAHLAQWNYCAVPTPQDSG